MNEDIKKLNEQIEELGQQNELEIIIQDNSIQFSVDKIPYKVRKPSLRETSQLNYCRLKKYNEMLEDGNYKLEAKWREVYKEQGINLDTMDSKLIELQRKEDDFMKKLGKQQMPKDIELLKETILQVREEKNETYQQKQELLQYSIETQLTNYMNEYLLSLILETTSDDKWVRVYEDHDSFLDKADQKLLVRATYYLSLLVHQNAV